MMIIKLSDILTPADGKTCICNNYWLVNDKGELAIDECWLEPFTEESKEELYEETRISEFDTNGFTCLFIPVAFMKINTSPKCP